MSASSSLLRSFQPSGSTGTWIGHICHARGYTSSNRDTMKKHIGNNVIYPLREVYASSKSLASQRALLEGYTRQSISTSIWLSYGSVYASTRTKTQFVSLNQAYSTLGS